MVVGFKANPKPCIKYLNWRITPMPMEFYGSLADYSEVIGALEATGVISQKRTVYPYSVLAAINDITLTVEVEVGGIDRSEQVGWKSKEVSASFKINSIGFAAAENSYEWCEYGYDVGMYGWYLAEVNTEDDIGASGNKISYTMAGQEKTEYPLRFTYVAGGYSGTVNRMGTYAGYYRDNLGDGEGVQSVTFDIEIVMHDYPMSGAYYLLDGDGMITDTKNNWYHHVSFVRTLPGRHGIIVNDTEYLPTYEFYGAT